MQGMHGRFDDLVKHILDGGLFLEQAVEVLEKALIAGALEGARGNQCEAAKALGIHRNTLQRKMIRFNLDGRRPRRKPAVRVVSRARTKGQAS